MIAIDTKWLDNGFASAIVKKTEFRGELTYEILPGRNREIIRGAKENGFNLLADLFAMDYDRYPVETPERFAVIYNLYSLATTERIFLKAFLPEDKPEIDSIHDLYKAVNWFEREAWDLFGIVFKGHPNLVRILCHNEFQGHPLRKDYPANGFQQLKNAINSTKM